MEIINNITRDKRHAKFATNPIYAECRYALQLPMEQRCEFVRTTEHCTELSFKINCPEFIFCTFSSSLNLWIPFFVLALFGIFLVYVVNLLITKYFAATTLAIGRMLDFNEYLTGVVVIAIANTLYNFYWVFYTNVTQDFGIVYNSSVGASLIGFGILVPIIIIMWPHKIIKDYMIIDTVFIVLNFIWLDLLFSSHKVNRLQAIGLASGYVLYIIILWVDSRLIRWQYMFHKLTPYKMAQLRYSKMPFKIFANIKNQKNYTDEEDQLMIKARRFAEWFDPLNRGPANQYIFKQFKDDLFDLEYSGVSRFIRFKRIVDTPFVIIFRFVMPVIDLRKPCHKWSKLLRIINVILFPSVCYLAMGLALFECLYVLIASTLLAIIIFFTSRTDRAPEYYPMFCLFVFFGYTFITFGIMSEVENIIEAIFMLLDFEVETTAHLAVSIFDMIPDISLAINLVQRGYPKIAWAGCFATTIFRGYFEIGVRFILRSFFNDSDTTIKTGEMGPTCSIYCILQMILLCIGLQTTNFFPRRILAYFLIVTYVIFVLFSLLVDYQQLHGFATDHMNEDDSLEGWDEYPITPLTTTTPKGIY